MSTINDATRSGGEDALARELFDHSPEGGDWWEDVPDAVREQLRMYAFVARRYLATTRPSDAGSTTRSGGDGVEADDPCYDGSHCCCCGPGEPRCECGQIMPSKGCTGEKCWCGSPAAKKVGEEMLPDEPAPYGHNLTAYVCARHYAQLMGLGGVEQVGVEAAALATARSPDSGCTASLDHGDILETIENAADDWQRKGYTSALAEVRDMANVGRALMEALPEGYSYNDCPSEIVADLLNERDEALARPSPSPAIVKEAGEVEPMTPSAEAQLA